MRQRTISLAVALTASIIGVLSGTAFGRAPSAAACAPERLQTPGSDTAVARGSGLVAVTGGRTLVELDRTGARRAFSAPAEEGVVRHVATAPGSGTAYVIDLPGPDTIVIHTRDRVIRSPQPGEATHPAWSPDGKNYKKYLPTLWKGAYPGHNFYWGLNFSTTPDPMHFQYVTGY